MSIAKLCISVLLVAALPLAAQAEGGYRGPGMMDQASPGQGGNMMGPGGPRQGGGMMGQGMPRQGMGAPRPFAGVEFSDEQRQRIQKMMEGERQSHQERVKKMRGFQQQLRKLYSADKWDAQAITGLYEKMHAEQRKTIAAMAEARNKVYELMTKKQREQMKQHQQRFAAPAAPQQ